MKTGDVSVKLNSSKVPKFDSERKNQCKLVLIILLRYILFIAIFDRSITYYAMFFISVLT